MADWIAVQKGLTRKREVLQLASMTGRTVAEVIVLLLEFWFWADAETADGCLPGMSIGQLAQAMPGTDERFWRAMLQVQWLLKEGDGFTVPNFGRWMGASAKRRLQKSDRQSAWRAGKVASQEDVDAPASTSAPLQERRGEEPPIPPERGEDVDLGSSGESRLVASFQDFWRIYPKRQKRERAWRAWNELSPGADLVRTILDAVTRQKDSADWRRESGRFVPLPAKWLQDRRWEDGASGKPQKTASDYLREHAKETP